MSKRPAVCDPDGAERPHEAADPARATARPTVFPPLPSTPVAALGPPPDVAAIQALSFSAASAGESPARTARRQPIPEFHLLGARAADATAEIGRAHV